MCSGMSARIREENSGVSTAGPSGVRPHKPVSSQRIAHWIKDL